MKTSIVRLRSDHNYLFLIAINFVLAYIATLKVTFHINTFDWYYLAILLFPFLIVLLVPIRYRRIFNLSVVALFIITIPLWIRGFNIYYNDAAQFIGRTVGYKLPIFEQTQYGILTIILWGLLIGRIVYYTSTRKKIWPYLISFMILTMWYLITQQTIPRSLYLLLIILLIFLYSFCKIQILTRKGLIFNSIILIFISLLMIVACLFIPSQSPIAYEKIKFGVEQLKYGQNTTDWHTNGNMDEVGSAIKKKDIALAVMMEKPTAIYLRGFVGAQYNHNQWSALSHNIYYNEQALLYGLQQEKMLSQTFLAHTYDASKEGIERNTVHIYPKHTTTKYSYVPYEIATAPYAKNFEEDGLNTNNEWTGKDHYEYKILENARTNYPITATTVKDKAFLKVEGHYNQFAYENYTSINKTDETTMRTHLGNNKDVTSYAEAIKKVQKFLTENLRYEEHIKKVPTGMNFLQYTLENTKRGYSPHYATIATIAFKYLGIPARYVEGYIISTDLTKEKEAYTEISVNGEQAHAWPEIYIDQLGWVPVEVTPGYEQKMPKLETLKNTKMTSEMSLNSSSSSHGNQRGNEAGAVQNITEPQQTIDPAPKKTKKYDYTILYIIICILCFIVLLISYFLWKRRFIRKYKKMLKSGDQKVVASGALLLLRWHFKKCFKMQVMQSNNNWLQVLPIAYQEHMNEFILIYNEIKYGQQDRDIRTAYDIVRNNLLKDMSKFKQIAHWMKGYI